MKELQREKIWDPVTRLWHWVLVLAISLGWAFGRFMNFDVIQWHFYIGYLVLALIAFRILWGFIGPRPVRFSEMLTTPAKTFKYLKTLRQRQPSGSPGHNPLGSLSVFALLLVILAQAGTGLFIQSDDFFEYGPLAGFVSESTVNTMTWWHRFNSDVVLALVVLHVTAVIFYLLWKRENLVMPMINGWKWVKRENPPVGEADSTKDKSNGK